MIAFFRSVRSQITKRDISCSLAGDSLWDISSAVIGQPTLLKHSLFSLPLRSLHLRSGA